LEFHSSALSSPSFAATPRELKSGAHRRAGAPSASTAMDGLERPPGSIDGEALAIAGMILGYAHLALIAFLVILVFGFLGGLAFFSHWHS
jgi:hypothetical protein